jgi:tetratricopeptide (TPR) repeat protein
MSPAPLEGLRLYYMAEGRSDDALKMLEQQAKLAAADKSSLLVAVSNRLNLAREYVARNRDADAAKALEDAMNITPFDARLHLAALPLHRKLGDVKKAVRSARCLVALRGGDDTDEDMADRWLSLAEVLLEDGQPKEAAAALAEAEKLAPEEQAERREQIRRKLGQ